jgi:gamma-glutamylcyclotransferase (GGCT)/AIG2-like uncharacterized protein YtfP
LVNFPDSQEYSYPAEAILFVYGSLRPGFGGEMAALLASSATHLGPATTQGALFRVDYYPAFVPGIDGTVTGDLFLMREPDRLLAILDDYEQCTAAYPPPHEFRRERLPVEAPWGPAEAWTYVYAWDTAGLEPIVGSDFLA